MIIKMVVNMIVKNKNLPHLLLLIFYCSTLYGNSELTYKLTSESGKNNKTTYHISAEQTITNKIIGKQKKTFKFNLTDVLPDSKLEEMNIIFILKSALREGETRTVSHTMFAIKGDTLFAFPLKKSENWPSHVAKTPLAEAYEINRARKSILEKLKKGLTPLKMRICKTSTITKEKTCLTITKSAIKAFGYGFFEETDLFVGFHFKKDELFKQDEQCNNLNGVVRSYICPSPPSQEDLIATCHQYTPMTEAAMQEKNVWDHPSQREQHQLQKINLAAFAIIKFSESFSQSSRAACFTESQWRVSGGHSAACSNSFLYAFSLDQQTPAEEEEESRNKAPNISSYDDFPPLK